MKTLILYLLRKLFGGSRRRKRRRQAIADAQAQAIAEHIVYSAYADALQAQAERRAAS